MSVRRFIQQRQEGQQTNANTRHENCCQPFNFPNERNLSVECEEFEEKEEIPLRTGQIGGVARVSFEFRRYADKHGKQNQDSKNAQGHDQVFEDAIWPEELAVI